MMLATSIAMAADPIGERASIKPSWTGVAAQSAADRSPMTVSLKRIFERESSDASAETRPERSARQWTGDENKS